MGWNRKWGRVAHFGLNSPYKGNFFNIVFTLIITELLIMARWIPSNHTAIMYFSIKMCSQKIIASFRL